jgi:hypothetical protein
MEVNDLAQSHSEAQISEKLTKSEFNNELRIAAEEFQLDANIHLRLHQHQLAVPPDA